MAESDKSKTQDQVAGANNILTPGEAIRWSCLCVMTTILWTFFISAKELNHQLDTWHWYRPVPFAFNFGTILLLVGLFLSSWLARRWGGLGLGLAGALLRLLVDNLSAKPYYYSIRTHYFNEALQVSPGQILLNYREVVEHAVLLPMFLDTKPPGLMLYYSSLVSGCRLFLSNTDDVVLLSALVEYVLLLACGVAIVWLLHRAVTTHWGSLAGAAAALLFACSPVFLLIPMEIPTRVTPLFAFGLWYLFRNGPSKRRAIAAGLLWALGSFIAFELLAALIIPFFLIVFHPIKRERLLAGIHFTIAVSGFYLVLFLFLRYNPFMRFEEAMTAHRRWLQIEQLPFFTRWLRVLRSIYEITLLGGGALVLFPARALWRRPMAAIWVAAAYVAVIPLTGQVTKESVRLWVQLLPFLGLVAGWDRWNRSLLVTAVACQLFLTVVCLLTGMYTLP